MDNSKITETERATVRWAYRKTQTMQPDFSALFDAHRLPAEPSRARIVCLVAAIIGRARADGCSLEDTIVMIAGLWEATEHADSDSAQHHRH